MRYGGIRHGLFGYYSPILHPIRWIRAYKGHAKMCRIADYLFDRRPFDEDAFWIVSNKTWVLFNHVMDYLG